MEKLAPKVLLKLWRDGKPLDKACFVFCDTEFTNAFPKWKDSKLRIKTNAKDALDNFAGSLRRFTNAQVKRAEYDRAYKMAWDNLLNNLYEKISSGELTAIAYKNPIKSETPSLVPLYMWPPENVETEKSTITSHGKTYVRVKIVKPDIKVKSDKVGRPSVREQIIATYEELQKAGKIDYAQSLQAHYQLLIATVSATHGVQVSDKTIYKYLGLMFKAQKKKSIN